MFNGTEGRFETAEKVSSPDSQTDFLSKTLKNVPLATIAH